MSSAVAVPAPSDQSGARWKTVIIIMALVVGGKGLAFVREAFVASQLGASASSDGYYLALAIPTLIYSLGALPFSMWATARLAALKGSGVMAQVASFYSRVLLLVVGLGAVVGLALIGSADAVLGLYAPGLDDTRLAQAAALTRIAALAIPALGVQAVCNGRLFADGRFLPAYVWIVFGGVVGLGIVILLTPHYGAAGAVWAFVGAAWTSIVGPVILARPSASDAGERRDVDWTDDLGVSVVYRALVMQLYFQASLMLVYGFGSTLPAGELAASLFGSKVQNAVYESLAVTAGVLVYPRIAHFLQTLDHASVKRTMLQALNWLLPATVALVVLLVTCRREIVSLVYERHAFDDRAARLVASALLGYAPGIVGLTLVEIFHRTMVLRGRLTGYVALFAIALLLNWLSCHFLVSSLGVLGLTVSSSVGVIAAGAGLIIYASRRLVSMDSRPMLLLVVRTTAAAGVTIGILMTLRARVSVGPSLVGQMITVAGSGVAIAAILSLVLFALGHRWQEVAPAKSRSPLG